MIALDIRMPQYTSFIIHVIKIQNGWHDIIICYCDKHVVIPLQLLSAMEKAYVISSSSKEDVDILLRALGNIRALLQVQAGPDEEELMKNSLKYNSNSKNLML